MSSKFKLKLTADQAAVLNQFITHTKLGNRNFYEDAISDLAIQMEADGIEGFLNDHYAETGQDRPEISVEFSEADGMIFNVDEFAG